MKEVKISVEEYLDLLRLKKKDLERKLEFEFKSLHAQSLDNCLIKLHKINEWDFERSAILEEIERYEPKLSYDDIPF